MTASLNNTVNPAVATGVDPFVNPPFIGYALRAPTSQDIYNPGTRWQDNSVNPPIIYETTGGGRWSTEGANHATTTTYGTVILTDNSEPVATKVYADNLAIAGAPVSTTTTAGIGELATDAEAIAGTPSTGTLALFVTPSNLAPVFSSPPAIGGTVAAAGTFTDLTADGTGQVSLGSNAAGDFTVSSGDLSLLATTNSVVINGAEAVDDAIQLTSSAGGLAGSFVKSIVLATTEANADSIQLTSSGGMDLTATGAAGKDIDIVCTSGSVNITAGENIASSMVLTNTGFQCNTTGAAAQDIILSNTGGSITLVATENAAQNIYLHANGGTSETIELRADQGTNDASIALTSDVGGITLTTGKDGANSMYLHANGGTSESIKIHSDQGTATTSIQLTSDAGGIQVLSGLNNANAIYLHADAGTSESIKIHADQGTGVASVNVLSDVGGVTIQGGKTDATAINLTASGAGGGMTLTSNTGGVTLTNTGVLSLAGSGASNITIATGDLSIIDTASSIILNAGEAVADAIDIRASNGAGGIKLTSGTGGVALTNTGALSLAGSGASNITIATGDLSIIDTASSIILNAGEAVADAIQLTTANVAGGLTASLGTGGLTMATTGAVLLDGQLASRLKVTGAADLTLQSTAGAVNVVSGEANADSINVTSAGGMNVVATGAAAKDTIITNTNGSMTLTAGESVSDAMNFTASGAASGMTLTAGTSGITFSSGQKVKVTSYAATSGSPYTVLGTDFYLALDVTGGVLTATLPAAPATGRFIIVSDSVGQSGANTITIDGNGKNISLAGTAAGTKTISTAYKAVGLIYNGTLWNGFALA